MPKANPAKALLGGGAGPIRKRPAGRVNFNAVSANPVAAAVPNVQTPAPGVESLADILRSAKTPSQRGAVAAAAKIDPTLLGQRVDPDAPDKTAQDQLNRIYRTTSELRGMPIPQATPEQEARFQKAKTDREFRRLQLRGPDSGRGLVRIGGPKGRTIEIAARDVGTRKGKQLATQAREELGRVTGTQQITVDGKTVSIPAHLNAQQVIDRFEETRNFLAENVKKRMSTQDVLASAVDTVSQVTGTIPDKPTITVGERGFSTTGPGRETPLTAYRTQQRIIRAERKAERTGEEVQVDAPIGFGPKGTPLTGRILARFISPSATKKDAIRFTRSKMREAKAALIRVKSKADAKAIKTNNKALSSFVTSSSTKGIFKDMNTALESFIEGTSKLTGKGEDREEKFIPGKGSVIPGRKFIGGVLQSGEITVAALEDTWRAMQAQFKKHGVPEGTFAYLFEGLFGRHSEWPQEVIREFMKKHPKAFAVQRSQPMRDSTASSRFLFSPEIGAGGRDGGGVVRGGIVAGADDGVTEAEFTELFELTIERQPGGSLERMEPTSEMEDIWNRMSERQKTDFVKQLDMNKGVSIIEG